jgi:hypothetical protein
MPERGATSDPFDLPSRKVADRSIMCILYLTAVLIIDIFAITLIMDMNEWASTGNLVDMMAYFRVDCVGLDHGLDSLQRY